MPSTKVNLTKINYVATLASLGQTIVTQSSAYKRGYIVMLDLLDPLTRFLLMEGT